MINQGQDYLTEVRQRLLGLHRRRYTPWGGIFWECAVCETQWPCETIKIAGCEVDLTPLPNETPYN